MERLREYGLLRMTQQTDNDIVPHQNKIVDYDLDRKRCVSRKFNREINVGILHAVIGTEGQRLENDFTSYIA